MIAPTTVVMEKRRDLKQKLRQTRSTVELKKKDLKSLEAKIWIAKTKLSEDNGGFSSKASDSKGRNYEFEIELNNHIEYKQLVAEIANLQELVEEVEDAVSDINFYQRQHLIMAQENFTNTAEILGRQIVDFKQAVDKFLSSRQPARSSY